MKSISFLLISLVLKYILSQPLCQEMKNYCEKCNPITNLCIQCTLNNFVPDNKGGCIGKCIIGNNYCNECDHEENLCKICEEGLHPDKFGGCSFTQNCEISFRGKCEKCIEGYILVGEENGFKICKNLNSDDLKNCKIVNFVNGLCNTCEDGYFMNKGDYRCTKTENCYESIFGACISCIEGYYLNKRKDICQKYENTLLNCKQTLDEVNCDICNKNYYLSEDGQCSDTIMCSKADKNICKECVSGYSLLENNSCSKEENCKMASKDTALCNLCMNGFYLDNKDRKCRTNKENNEFKNCEIYNNGCSKCENGYFVSEDSKCVKTRGCAESDNGICIKCAENYFMGLDNNCTTTEHCIYSGKDSFYGCDECEPNYCYNSFSKICFLIEEEKFYNCKIAYGTRCSVCHDDFYLNDTNSLCYDNTDKKDSFYKCSKTDYYGKECFKCIEGYYLGSEDRKCSKIENCKISENENKCIECSNYYCLDVKNQKCMKNNYLYNENEKIFMNCNKTNEKGDRCEECLDGYEVGHEGYCIDAERCVEKKDGICLKCRNDENDGLFNYKYCANSIFGCIKTVLQNCIKCDNIFNLFACTECEDGYKINEYGMCVKE